jgi:hypothetical protein
MNRIKLTIDRLVLTGFDPADRNALADGLQGELSRLLADPATGAASTQSRRTPVVRLGPMPLDPGRSGGRKLGQGIARGIGKGLKP